MPKGKQPSIDSNWIGDWIGAVEMGKATMSQRTLTSIEVHGGLQAVVEAAQSAGVHLMQLTDDKGKVLVAASRNPFTTLC